MGSMQHSVFVDVVWELEMLRGSVTRYDLGGRVGEKEDCLKRHQ